MVARRTFESSVVRAVSRSPSVRTTIPEAVAAILGAEPNDVLVWEVELGSGRIFVSVRRPGRPGTTGPGRKPSGSR